MIIIKFELEKKTLVEMKFQYTAAIIQSVANKYKSFSKKFSPLIFT
jgi:hypothetical protein